MNRPLVLTVALFAVLWLVIPYLHEAGHAAVCESYGYSAQIYVTTTGEARAATCSEAPGNLTLYWAAGGLTGATSAAALLASRRKEVYAAALPFVAQSLALAIMETFFHSWYVLPGNPVSSAIASGLAVGLFMLLLVRLKILRSRPRRAARTRLRN